MQVVKSPMNVCIFYYFENYIHKDYLIVLEFVEGVNEYYNSLNRN